MPGKTQKLQPSDFQGRLWNDFSISNRHPNKNKQLVTSLFNEITKKLVYKMSLPTDDMMVGSWTCSSLWNEFQKKQTSYKM